MPRHDPFWGVLLIWAGSALAFPLLLIGVVLMLVGWRLGVGKKVHRTCPRCRP